MKKWEKKGIGADPFRTYTLFICPKELIKMRLIPDSPLMRLPDIYPTYSLIRKALNYLETVTAATYTDIQTASGHVIRIVNEMSLGEVLSVMSMLLLIAVLILFFFMDKIWKAA